jgi:hypothetical protein
MRDLKLWEALYAVDPWTEGRADERAGQIASAALAPHTKRGHTPRWTDFFRRLSDGASTPQPKQDDAEIKAAWARTVKRWPKKQKKDDG